MAATDIPKIVRILDVRDTRQYEEIDDKWVAIPGTGNARPCDRCGRSHEVHVDVELSDGTTANIGQGCARGESMDVQSRIKGGISAAITLARLRRELDAIKERHARAETIHKAVMALPLPDIVLAEEHTASAGRLARRIYTMGDAKMTVLDGKPIDAIGKQSLAHSWRSARFTERMGDRLGPIVLFQWKTKIDDLTKRIHRTAAKVKAFLG